MREEQSRRQQFTQGSVSTLLPPSVAGKQGSLLLQEETSSSSVVINLDSAMMQAVQDDTVSFIVNIITILSQVRMFIGDNCRVFNIIVHWKYHYLILYI